MAAERELIDLFLVERRSSAEVRVRLASSLPTGHELVDLHDVWLGDPPLSGQIVAAEYRMEVGASRRVGADADAGPDDGVLDIGVLATACLRLLDAESLPRSRDKGGRAVTYDLRPLVEDVRVVTDPGGASAVAVLVIRTRFDPERGVGRPDELLAALSELAGVPLSARSIVRERLLLAGDAWPVNPTSGHPALSARDRP